MQYYSITDTLNWWDIQRGGGREVKGYREKRVQWEEVFV